MGMRNWILVSLVILALSAAPALAGKGNGKGGGGGGGGDPPPAADAAIAWADTSGRSGSMWQVRTMNADGSDQGVLVSASGDGMPADASWAPDGNELVYRGRDGVGFGLFVVQKDGSGIGRIHVGVAYDPKWSPQATVDGGEKVLFAAAAPEKFDLFALSIDGQTQRNLTNSPDLHETYPTWSPSADRVAARYTEYDQGGAAVERGIIVYALGTDTAGNLAVVGSTRFTDATLGLTDVTFLDWARTQDAIACAASDSSSGKRDIWVIDLGDASNPSNVTTSTDVDEKWPSWSPDDAQIVYSRYGKGKKDKGIFVRNADGSGTATGLATGGGEHYRRPCWRR